MKFKDIKKELLENSPEFREAYLSPNRGLELGHLIARERVRNGLTQEELAEMIGTQQPSIARAESGTTIPSITFLDKIAGALDTSLAIEFKKEESRQGEWNEAKEKSPYFKLGLVPIDISTPKERSVVMVGGELKKHS